MFVTQSEFAVSAFLTGNITIMRPHFNLIKAFKIDFGDNTPAVFNI